MERTTQRFHGFTGAFVARRQPVAFVQGFRDHDPLLAIHQVKGGSFLVGNTDAQFERRQAGLGRQLVVAAHDFNHLSSKHTGPAHGQAGFALLLVQGQDHSVAFDEYFAGPIFRQQLVYRIVEIQAEVGCRVQSRVHERACEPRRITDIGLDDHVAQRPFFRRLLLFRQVELVERAVHRRELAQLGVADQVHAV